MYVCVTVHCEQEGEVSSPSKYNACVMAAPLTEICVFVVENKSKLKHVHFYKSLEKQLNTTSKH